MTRRKPLAVALLATGIVLAPTTAALAAGSGSTCDAYSQNCTNVEGKKIVKPPAVQPQNATLPFTGGEILLMTVAGGAAIGGGIVLVTAGRRRRQAQPA